MRRYGESGKSLTGSSFRRSLPGTGCSLELNASMGRIVATPTAGSAVSSGCPYYHAGRTGAISEWPICVMALHEASAIGMVIANNASLAGAQEEEGCQAEMWFR